MAANDIKSYLSYLNKLVEQCNNTSILYFFYSVILSFY